MNSKLTVRQRRATVLVAEDQLTDEEIAREVGITRRTLAIWKNQLLFVECVRQAGADLWNAAMRRGIARRDRRLAALQKVHNRLLAVIEARAADPDMKSIPGGSTGLIVRKPVTSAGTVAGYEYAVDTGTIAEIRKVQELAAKELGQLTERHEHRVIRSFRDLTDDELQAMVESGEFASLELTVGGGQN
jgi:hypothetical protein